MQRFNSFSIVMMDALDKCASIFNITIEILSFENVCILICFCFTNCFRIMIENGYTVYMHTCIFVVFFFSFFKLINCMETKKNGSNVFIIVRGSLPFCTALVSTIFSIMKVSFSKLHNGKKAWRTKCPNKNIKIRQFRPYFVKKYRFDPEMSGNALFCISKAPNVFAKRIAVSFDRNREKCIPCLSFLWPLSWLTKCCADDDNGTRSKKSIKFLFPTFQAFLR